MTSERLLFAGVALGAIAVAAALVARKDREPAPLDVQEAETATPTVSAVPIRSVPEPPVQRLPTYVRSQPDDAISACGDAMLLVDGVYCPFVGHPCTEETPNGRGECDAYSTEVLCEGRLQQRRYCIDRFEYPNLEGVLPAVLVTFEEASRACAVEGKRLCSVEEWEFACEGTGMWPLPYGRVRSPDTCNAGKPPPEDRAVHSLLTNPRLLSSDLSAVDRRAPSGAFEACISPFGVRDLVGNVAEWVLDEGGKAHEKPFRSAQKGGSWMLGGPSGRAACRPVESDHAGNERAIDVGFRCCKDAKGSRPVEPARGQRVPSKTRMDTPSSP